MNKIAVFCLIVGLTLSGCALPPRMAESKKLALPESPIDQLVVVYRNNQLRTVSATSFGRMPSSIPTPADTGLREFGDQVVAEAPGLLATRQIQVAKAVVIAEQQPLPSDISIPMLVLAPTNGRLTSSTMSTVARFSFSAQLLDPVRRRLLWQGTVDTNAWVGQDFVMKNFEKTTYNAILARKFLKSVVDQLAEDGLIR